jgi:hypothetical protein
MPKFDDLSRSLVALDQDSTLISVIELSQSRWLVGGIVPGVDREPMKKLAADPDALLRCGSCGEHMVNSYFGLARPGAADAANRCRSALPSCYHLFPRPGIQEFQLLSPDPYLAARATLRQPAQATACGGASPNAL